MNKCRTLNKELKTRNTRQGLLFVISGPSGSGKTTLIQGLLAGKDLKKKIIRSISFTTRPRRPGEKEGRDYFFLTRKEFQEKLKEQKILEWTRYLGYDYGTSKDFVETHLRDSQRAVVLCLDVKGARQIKRFYPGNSITIFVSPPSLEVLEKRIKKRCARTQGEEIRRRLKLSRRELLKAPLYDYHLVNKDLEQAKRKLKEIIVKELRSAYG